MFFGSKKEVFGCIDIEECMLLRNIKHGYGYSSCDYYPQAKMAYPGYIKVSTETREIIEHVQSKYPGMENRYPHYARREILNLRADHDHRREHLFKWIKDPYSDF